MSKLILEGFMGCGKTTYGKALADKLGIFFMDTDKSIEQMAGMSVSSIFARRGEADFRDMESALLTRIAEQPRKYPRDMILSIGGGMPVKLENRINLKMIGKVVYLRATEALLVSRLQGDNADRPMIAGDDPAEKIHKLLKEREAIYLDAANVIIDIDGKSDEQIVKELGRYIIV